MRNHLRLADPVCIGRSQAQTLPSYVINISVSQIQLHHGLYAIAGERRNASHETVTLILVYAMARVVRHARASILCAAGSHIQHQAVKADGLTIRIDDGFLNLVRQRCRGEFATRIAIEILHDRFDWNQALIDRPRCILHAPIEQADHCHDHYTTRSLFHVHRGSPVNSMKEQSRNNFATHNHSTNR